MQNVELAKITHQLAVANGSTDPTFSVWWSHNPSFTNPYANNTIGASVSIPLRIFDRNQGEKARTQIDIGRNERLRDAAEAQVFNDVDSAYWTLVQNVNLLKPYKAKYLPLATDVRDKMSFSYQNGGASLLDYLDAEKSYRDTRLAYLNLIGSYLTAAAQMNMAAGREVDCNESFILLLEAAVVSGRESARRPGASKKVVRPEQRGSRARVRYPLTVEPDLDRQQFQGGPSRAVSAGDGG